MSEDSDTKESLKPSAVKSGGGCPAEGGMTGYPTLSSEGERSSFIKPRARNGSLEQYIQKCRGSQCLQSWWVPWNKEVFLFWE